MESNEESLIEESLIEESLIEESLSERQKLWYTYMEKLKELKEVELQFNKMPDDGKPLDFDAYPDHLFAGTKDEYAIKFLKMKILQDQIQNNEQNGPTLEDQILDLTRKYEREILESGEWQSLVQNAPNSYVSDVLSSRVSELGGDELRDLKQRKREEDSSKSMQTLQQFLNFSINKRD